MTLTAANAVVAALPAIGTVAAAIITGFGAAALKRRWDVDSERVRWERESAGRDRQERIDAFRVYLAARPSRAIIAQRVALTRHGGYVDLDSMVSALRLEAMRLLILLPDEGHRQVVEKDLEQVQVWMQTVAQQLTQLDSVPDVATAEPLLALARELSGKVSR